MKLGELQKLDFLLKKINSRTDSVSYRIAFALNKDFFTGDFVPEIEKSSVKITDVTSIETNSYTNIELEDTENWSKLFENTSNYFEKYFDMLVDRSGFKNSSDYFRLLEDTLKNYSFEFSQELPPIIYNVESLTQNLSLHFFRVDENINFDSISIISEDELNNQHK